jgi:hypothetical protein
MASFSIDGPIPNVGYNQGIGAYSYKFGIVISNRLFQFDAHATRGPFAITPAEEYRYDYALLYGISKRNESSFLNFAGGFSMIDYLHHGNVIIPPSYPDGENGTYQTVSGTAFGISIMADAYWTPFQFWGALGIGLYGTLATKGQSYIALEFSLIELNIPIPIR